MMHGQKNIKSG